MNKLLTLALIAGLAGMSPVALAAPVPLPVSGKSVEGRPIPVYRFGDGDGEYVFLFGVFHGDEPQGAYMLQQMMELLELNPAYYAGKSIFVVPVVNPDGLQKRTRVNARQVDLNRNFPTRDFKPGLNKGTRWHGGPAALSEPESRLIHDLLKPYVDSQPDERIKILSIHAPLAVNNYDGPARALAERLRAYNGYTAAGEIGYSTPGSFGTYYGKERGIRVLTLETSKETPQAAWQRHQKAMLALLQYPDQNLYPSALPSPVPTISPSPLPSPIPTPQPTVRPTPVPTPSPLQTPEPTPEPTESPSRWWPLRQPAPVMTPVPTAEPTPVPTPLPTSQPTAIPSSRPTPLPTARPTPKPYQPGQIRLPRLSRQVVLTVSKKTQRLTVVDGGKTLASFPVSTGLGAKDTPNGSFRVLTKVVYPAYNGSLHRGKRSWPPKNPNNPLGTRWMQISAWHYKTSAMLGIHGTDEPLGIGKAVSGGCVRMHNADVERLFEALPVGAKVVITAQ